MISQLTFTCSNSTTETRKKCEISTKLTIKTPERRQCLSGVFIVDFEHVNVSWDNNDHFKTFLVNVPFPDQRIRKSEAF